MNTNKSLVKWVGIGVTITLFVIGGFGTYAWNMFSYINNNYATQEVVNSLKESVVEQRQDIKEQGQDIRDIRQNFQNYLVNIRGMKWKTSKR